MFKKFISCLLLVCVFFSCAMPKVNAEELQTITKIEQVEDTSIYETDHTYDVGRTIKVEQVIEDIPFSESEQFHALVDLIGTALLGEFGFHQFYNGHFILGILFVCTAGLFGFGYIYSIVVTIINFVNVIK